MKRRSSEEPTGTATLRAAAIYFAMVFGAGFVLGAIRVPFLVPRWGVRASELLEMPLMLLAIVVAAGLVVRWFGAMIAPGAWWRVGVLALALMIAAELLLAVALSGRSVGEYIASRDPVSGSVYLILLVVFAAMPWWRHRRRKQDGTGTARTARASGEGRTRR